ncbi:hypothetical protein K505DRAFT_109370 [Melanomma pulvis-pyrius CBS 109.77]|uniref:Uncharacterized protein n=1 Tax=Melanomma pulvis-pyrius CBS 109.77 TaxID=1314802 RepID=A0A6A6WWY8_9PLEO|nr:hypothetical protein K505DRAFT_109370 [Melanomma pulvis-pyrius CBS 109.77]
MREAAERATRATVARGAAPAAPVERAPDFWLRAVLAAPFSSSTTTIPPSPYPTVSMPSPPCRQREPRENGRWPAVPLARCRTRTTASIAPDPPHPPTA